jgi:alpha-L-glutamate ligase-like protein
MKWLLNLRRLPARGVLGINRRNAGGICERNARSLFPVVDDKLLMAHMCARIGVRSPTILGVISRHAELKVLERIIRVRNDLVIKPARGSGGRGIMILVGRRGSDYQQANGRGIDSGRIRRHTADILAGMYSLGGRPDRAILQERVRPHPAFASIAPHGIADVRIVLYRFVPAMAMLRLPTLASNGRANLHQGGIGVGIDLAAGRSHHAVHRDRFINRHPDTGEGLLDLIVPCWDEILEIAQRAARAVGLGFVGIDLVIDDVNGPMLLEANARPGLTIQLANNRGLLERIEEIDRQLESAARM